VLEAMAFSLPIVTTSVGGLKYFFQEGKMGYTAIPKESKDLKEKLRNLILNHSSMVEMGKFNYDYAQEHLMSDSIASRLHKHLVADLYSETDI
jgi:glycosyltransferase involved in cell wall biosynthesis